MPDNTENQRDENQTDENERRRAFSLFTLNDPYISGVAASAFGNFERYGRLPEELYLSSVSETPSESAYQNLILRELLSDEVPDNSLKFRIKQRAKRIVNEAFDNLKVEDVFAIHGIGVNEGNQQTAGRYIRDLNDSQRNSLREIYFQSYVDMKIGEFLSRRIQSRGRTIEDIFAQPETNN